MNTPHIVQSISEPHRLMDLPAPAHPLVSVISMADIRSPLNPGTHSIVYNFYSVCAKKGFNGKLKYGQTYYDFDRGIMTFFSPKQVTAAEVTADQELSGWWLVVHPDFLRGYPLGTRMKDYGFFSYAVHEDEMLAALIAGIDREHRSAMDAYNGDVLVPQIELLLNYCNRFYNRQFITRKNAGGEILTHFEAALDAHFDGKSSDLEGLPSVQQLASKLTVSAGYLSDMLRSLTCLSAQQHIHNKLIERSKTLLSTTALSVGEIAYQLASLIRNLSIGFSRRKPRCRRERFVRRSISHPAKAAFIFVNNVAFCSSTLGRSGLLVSPLTLGTMTYAAPRWGSPDVVSEAIFNAYVDAGGNSIDTADVYSGGKSEELTGQFIKARGLRDKVVLATKCGFAGGNSRKNIHRALDASLRRLQTDYIDLYWMHVWDGVAPMEEVVQTLTDLTREGKIRYYGFSDNPAWYAAKASTIAALRGWPAPVAMQLAYSLVERNMRTSTSRQHRNAGLVSCLRHRWRRVSLQANTPAMARPQKAKGD